MEKSDWQSIIDAAPRENLAGLMWRVVEDQSEIATVDLVDTIEEQVRLEELLEGTKPANVQDAPKDYLLATPFRYPPLKWGSRFGRVTEMSIFYGSLEVKTALSELAYYRLVFLDGIEGELPNPVVRASYDLFSAKYNLTPGMDLSKAPFRKHAQILTHKSHYQATQTLGSLLRDDDLVDGLIYVSARCPDGGLNVAIFKPRGLQSKKPVELRKCYAEASTERVAFKLGRSEVVEFKRDLFLVRGELPSPA